MNEDEDMMSQRRKTGCLFGSEVEVNKSLENAENFSGAGFFLLRFFYLEKRNEGRGFK